MKIATVRLASSSRMAGMPGMGGFGGSGGFGSGGAGGAGAKGGGFGGGGGRYNQNRYNPVYDDLSEGTIIEQFMPVDPRRLHRIWRRIYLQDAVAGPAVELYKDLPWSDFQLGDIEDSEIDRFYTDALNAINCVALLPQISAEFLVMGKVIGAIHMDDSKGYPTRIIIHDPDWIRVTPIPIPGFQPKLDIIPTPEMRSFANSKDERDVDAQQQIPWLIDIIKSGKEIPLPTDNSFYIARKTSPYDMVGASIYTRILLFVAYEKALVNSTIAVAKRRISRIRHITAGIDDVWSPTQGELDDLTGLFMQGDEDPVGAIVATRTGVNISEVGGATLSDVLKISDEWQFLQAGKLNSLGVSEEFLSGNSSYNSMEQLLSVFMERIKAHREFFTHEFILDKLLKPLAIKHGFIRRSQAQLSHRIRVSSKTQTMEDYILPSINWQKNLRPIADKNYLEILGAMEEKGIPVTIKTWANSAGFDLETEINQFDDDLDRRKKLAEQIKKIKNVAPEAAGQPGAPGNLGGGMGGGFGGSSEMDLSGLGGGEMGGAGGFGGAGGEEAGGAGEEKFELPTAASVRKASVDENVSLSLNRYVESNKKDCSINNIAIAKEVAGLFDTLPYWESGKDFLGTNKEEVKKYATLVLNAIGTGENRAVLASEDLNRIRTGHAKRDQVIKYILGRVGILHGFSLSKDVVDDLVDEILKIDDKRQIAAELRYVYAYSVISPVKIEEKPREVTSKVSKTTVDIGRVQSSFNTPDNTLLTGYSDTKL